MDTDLRKQTNLRFDRLAPRFVRKREQEQQHQHHHHHHQQHQHHHHLQQHLSSSKKDKGGAPASEKTSAAPGAQQSLKPKEASPEAAAEDNDWETASENSDPERHKDARERLARGKQAATPSSPWQQAVGVGGGKGHARVPLDARKQQQHPAKLDKKGAPAKGKNGEHVAIDGSEGTSGVVANGPRRAKGKHEKNNPIERIDLSNYARKILGHVHFSLCLREAFVFVCADK